MLGGELEERKEVKGREVKPREESKWRPYLISSILIIRLDHLLASSASCARAVCSNPWKMC